MLTLQKYSIYVIRVITIETTILFVEKTILQMNLLHFIIVIYIRAFILCLELLSLILNQFSFFLKLFKKFSLLFCYSIL